MAHFLSACTSAHITLIARCYVQYSYAYTFSFLVYYRYFNWDENVLTSKLINFMVLNFDERFKVGANNKISSWRQLLEVKKVTFIFSICRWEIAALFLLFDHYIKYTVCLLPPSYALWNFILVEKRGNSVPISRDDVEMAVKWDTISNEILFSH